MIYFLLKYTYNFFLAWAILLIYFVTYTFKKIDEKANSDTQIEDDKYELKSEEEVTSDTDKNHDNYEIKNEAWHQDKV